MANKPTERFTFTAPAILAHPTLFTARGFGPKGKETGEPKFSANFIIDPAHPDWVAMKDMAIRLAKATWPSINIGEAAKAGQLLFPFKNGTSLADERKQKCEAAQKKPDGEFQRGKGVLVARTKLAPRLSVILNGRPVDLDTDDLKTAHAGKFYFGTECLAQVTFVTHDKVGGNAAGVNAWLDMVLSLNKGEKLSSGGSAAEVFKGYVGHTSTEDPTGGPIKDDEIPF